MGVHVGNGGANGFYEFRNDGHAYTNGGWNSSSDARMKTQVEKIDNALEKLDRISGYTYLKQGVTEAGVIAQELEEVLPQAVSKTELTLNDGSVLPDARSININGVVALLIEALLDAVRDSTTGLDKITVPAMSGAPSRTILVNPVPIGPAAPWHTGNSGPVPVTPVHTGTEVKQADSIVTTTLPIADIPPLQDFIYWQPDASGTGVEPIYVMTSQPRKGVKDYGHDYHPAPKTEEIKGLGELIESRKKTPKQGGGGRRDRWVGDKGRKIYEWDSQHGELEGYRASDGSHLGAFDPNTGKQLKGPDPKRNIKKYL